MRVIKYSAMVAVAVVLVLTIAILAMLALSPATLARPVLAYYLSAAGFELVEFSGVTLSRDHSRIQQLTIANNSVKLGATDTTLSYALSELFAGQLRGIDVEHLLVEIAPEQAATATTTTEDPVELNTQISNTLRTINNLPLQNFHIGAIDVRSENTNLDIALQANTQPLRVAGSIESSEFIGLLIQLDMAADEDGIIQGEVNALLRNQPALQSTLTITPVANALHVQSSSQFNPAPILDFVKAANDPAIIEIDTDTITLTLDFIGADLLESPAITSFTALLDSPTHRLHVKHTDNTSAQEMNLQLPLEIAGELTSLEQGLTLAIEDVVAALTYADPATQMQGDLNLDKIALACSTTLACNADAGIVFQLEKYAADGLSVENVTLRSNLSASSDESGFILATPELEIDNSEGVLTHSESDTSFRFHSTISDVNLLCSPAFSCQGDGLIQFDANDISNPSIKVEHAQLQGPYTWSYVESQLEFAMSTLAADIPDIQMADYEMGLAATFTNATVQLGEETRASFSVASDRITTGLADIIIRNPSFSADVEYANDNVSGALRIAIANQLQAQANGEFNLATQAGTLNWEIAPYFFSSITPLSALVTQSIIKTDIVAGSIAGSGNLTLGTDADGNWQAAGPANIQLNELAGFVEDVFYVGLTSEIKTVVADNWSLKSAELLTARIATLDVGLPLTDIRWDYNFDSADQSVAVKNLAIYTLGGEITMADFDYALANPNTKLTVVITNLDLHTIVELAQYPGLNVQGTISGYLPLTLTGKTVTVEKGLIGALQPGGTIRYASGTPADTGNSTMDLVNEALANYHYQIMNTYVYYNDNGDLRLEVQLQGNNPDLYNGQVVNLNVNIADNIPTLLRSLQAGRTISDALEKRLQSQGQNGTQ